MSVDPAVDDTGTPYAFTGGDPVNESDSDGMKGGRGGAVVLSCGGGSTRPICEGWRHELAQMSCGPWWQGPLLALGLIPGAEELEGVSALADAADAADADEGASALEQTVHGADRAADPSRLDIDAQAEVIANATQTYTQADGAQVYVQDIGGKFNVVVQGDNGVITNLKTISESSLDRLATRYAWTPN